MAAWPLSIAMMIAALTTMSLLSSGYLCWAHRWGGTAALLASAPGVLSQVMVMAAELGIDMRAVAVVQTIRVMVVSIGLPLALTLLGLVGPSTSSIGGAYNPDCSANSPAVLIVVSSAVAVLLQRIWFPGGLMFGAMLCSGVLHGTGLIHAVMPRWWPMPRCCRSAASPARGSAAPRCGWPAPKFLAAGLGWRFPAPIAALFVLILGLGTGLRIAYVSIAFAPGAVDATTALALALNLDPVMSGAPSGAHHVRLAGDPVRLALVGAPRAAAAGAGPAAAAQVLVRGLSRVRATPPPARAPGARQSSSSQTCTSASARRSITASS